MKNYGKMQPIRVGTKRIVPYAQVLGIYKMPPFSLKKGDIIEVLEKDIYGRFYIKLHDTKFWIWAKILDQISNEIKDE